MPAQPFLENMLGYFFGDAQSGHYYVYVLFRPDGRPFYVGKGVGNRIDNHETEARRGHKCRKCNTIRKIWREGGQVDKQIVFRTNSEITALQFEAQLIQRWRQQLANVYDNDPRLKPLERRRHTTKKERAAAHRHRALQMLDILARDLRYVRRYTPEDTEAERRILEEMDSYRTWIRQPDQKRLGLD